MLRNKQDGKSGSNIFQTPTWATMLLKEYLNPDWTVWEPAAGKHLMAKDLSTIVKVVKPTDILEDVIYDFRYYNPKFKYDAIITNPPYSIKDDFVRRCYFLQKPFALLMPLTALEGIKRQFFYRRFGLQIIIPNKRINYLTPSGEGSGSWFASAWFTNWLYLEKDITFVDVKEIT